MQRNNRYTSRLVVLATLSALGSLGISGAAHAERGPRMMNSDEHVCIHGQGMGGLQAGGPDAQKRAEYLDARLNRLKSELKITAEQEKVWGEYAAKSKQLAEALPATKPAPAAGAAPLSAPERLEQSTARIKQHLTYLEGMAGALKSLYAVLTPEQKAQADKHFMHMSQRRNMGERGMMKRGGPAPAKTEAAKPAAK